WHLAAGNSAPVGEYGEHQGVGAALLLQNVQDLVYSLVDERDSAYLNRYKLLRALSAHCRPLGPARKVRRRGIHGESFADPRLGPRSHYWRRGASLQEASSRQLSRAILEPFFLHTPLRSKQRPRSRQPTELQTGLLCHPA